MVFDNNIRPVYVPQKAYSFNAFNTINTVTIYGEMSEEEIAAVFASVQQEADRFERLFSHTLPESALFQYNQGTPLESLDPELGELIDLGLAYGTATDGLFDIAYAGPIMLGGIAKGYIADALVVLLKDCGVQHGIVNLGGNVAVFGGKPSGEGATVPFTVGLRVPKQHALGEDYFAAVQLAEGSVVTSGIYERGEYAPDGSWQHHIIDPRTGRSAETDLVSASLISETSLDGDGYTTALIIMGLDRALEFVESLPGCEAVFVTNTGEVHFTSGIK